MKPESNVLSQDEAQRKLQLYRQPEPNTVPMETIRKQRTSGAAFTLAVSSCGELDQTIYEFVGIDPGTFSKMKRGLATLQAEDLEKFCYAVNNQIYPEWYVFQIGNTMVQIETETQKQLRIERDKRIAAETTLSQVLQGMVGRQIA